MKDNELKVFIKQNASWIYEYINNEILRGIGKIHPNYFVKCIEEIFIKQCNTQMSLQTINPNVLPYFIFTSIARKGRMDYTSLRTETINFNEINEEAKVYYNYARFSLNEGFLCIDLMQTKIGGMPIDEDIVKFSKRVPIKNLGLEEFIKQNKDTKKNEILKKIEEEIEVML